MWSGWFSDVPHGYGASGWFHMHVHAGEPGVERTVGGHLAERPAAPVALRRHVDHVGVDAPHVVVAEPETVEHAAAEVLGDDVGAGAQLQREAAALLGRQVERDALAAAVLGVEGERLVELRGRRRRSAARPGWAIDSIRITSAPSSDSTPLISGTTAAAPNSITRIPSSSSSPDSGVPPSPAAVGVVCGRRAA